MEVPTRKSVSQSPRYVTHFGELDHQAAINSVEAYLENNQDKRMAIAWLLMDSVYISETMNGYSAKQRHERINDALTKVARGLWQRDEMQPYKDKRVVIELPLSDHQETA